MGRLEFYKGLDVFVEACDQRNFGHKDPIRAVIAGPGVIEKLIKMPPPKNIELLARLIHDEEAVDLFRGCGLKVLPYIEASQSALVATAYFFRKPVIVTRVGALPEYVAEGETGWVIPPNDPAALADCLRNALGDLPQLERMGNAGREWYEHQRKLEMTTLQDMYHLVVGQS